MAMDRERTGGGKLRFLFAPECVKAARGGDREAFAKLLFALYAKEKAILAWIRSRRKNWGDTQCEAALEAFHERFNRQFDPDHQGEELTGLGGLCVQMLNWSLLDIDRQRVHLSIDDDGGKDSKEFSGPTLTDQISMDGHLNGVGRLAHEAVEERECRAGIRDLLKEAQEWMSKLSPVHREIMQRNAGGEKQREISEAMNVPMGTVGVVLARTRAALLEKFGKKFESLFVNSSRGH